MAVAPRGGVKIAMRLIYEGGQKIGYDPIGYYVYLWRHGDIDRYVGKGVNDRWLSHATPQPNDNNQRKYRYFRDNLGEMSCLIIAEGLAEQDAFLREIADIDRRGLATLVNHRRGSNGPGVRRGKGTKYVSTTNHHHACVTCPDFPHGASLRFLRGDNPWGIGSPGREFYAVLLNKQPATIGEALDFAAIAGWKAKEAMKHLRWLYTWGDYIAIDGKQWAKGA